MNAENLVSKVWNFCHMLRDDGVSYGIHPENPINLRTVTSCMHKAGLSPPSFDSDRYRDQFVATYLFHHFLTEEDILWLGRFRSLALTEDQQRALIFVRETGRITNSDYRDLNRVDTLTASQRLTRLRDLGLVEQVPRGPATYYVPGNRLGLTTSEGEEPAHGDLFAGLSPESEGAEGLSRESAGLSQEPRALSQESEGLSQESFPRPQLLDELPPELRQAVEGLGQRSRDPGRLRQVIQALCARRPYLARELASLLGRRQDYLHRQYLAPLIEDGTLRYRYPGQPNRPDQAYISNEDTE